MVLAFCRVPPRPPMELRSYCNRRLPTVQPSPGWPMRLCFGTRTSSKKVWQNSELPLMSSMGVTVTPVLSMSSTRKEMPSCLEARGSVRTRQKIQSAPSAPDVQIFEPFTTYSSPSSSARICRLARSEPAPGSL